MPPRTGCVAVAIALSLAPSSLGGWRGFRTPTDRSLDLSLNSTLGSRMSRVVAQSRTRTHNAINKGQQNNDNNNNKRIGSPTGPTGPTNFVHQGKARTSLRTPRFSADNLPHHNSHPAFSISQACFFVAPCFPLPLPSFTHSHTPRSPFAHCCLRNSTVMAETHPTCRIAAAAAAAARRYFIDPLCQAGWQARTQSKRCCDGHPLPLGK